MLCCHSCGGAKPSAHHSSWAAVVTSASNAAVAASLATAAAGARAAPAARAASQREVVFAASAPPACATGCQRTGGKSTRHAPRHTRLSAISTPQLTSKNGHSGGGGRPSTYSSAAYNGRRQTTTATASQVKARARTTLHAARQRRCDGRAAASLWAALRARSCRSIGGATSLADSSLRCSAVVGAPALVAEAPGGTTTAAGASSGAAGIDGDVGGASSSTAGMRLVSATPCAVAMPKSSSRTTARSSCSSTVCITQYSPSGYMQRENPQCSS